MKTLPTGLFHLLSFYAFTEVNPVPRSRGAWRIIDPASLRAGPSSGRILLLPFLFPAQLTESTKVPGLGSEGLGVHRNTALHENRRRMTDGVKHSKLAPTAGFFHEKDKQKKSHITYRNPGPRLSLPSSSALRLALPSPHVLPSRSGFR